MKRQPRFEVVGTDVGWHARFVAANGRTVWTTEVYERRRAAWRAIYLIAKPALQSPWLHAVWIENYGCVEVRFLDERGKSAPTYRPASFTFKDAAGVEYIRPYNSGTS